MREFRVTPTAGADIDAVQALLAAAGRRLALQGFRNWETPYPRAALEADVRAGAVFLVRSTPPHAVPLATYTLRSSPVHPYVPAPWATPEAPARYLNRLAVDPERQGAGLGAWCLTRIARAGIREGAGFIRCDVLSANARLCQFYEQGGYLLRGTRSHSGWEFACYEQSLAGGATAPEDSAPGPIVE